MLTRLLSNATANVANGLSVAGFQIAMTAIVAHRNQPDLLPMWSLSASIAGVAPLMACNLSAVVARRLAIRAVDRDQPLAGQQAVMYAARFVVARMLMIGVAIAIVLAFVTPAIYPKSAGSRPLDLGLACSIYFAGACWTVASQSAQGWLIVAHRNWVIAGCSWAARLLALVATILALHVWKAPMWVGLMICSVMLWSGTLLMNMQVPRDILLPAGQPDRDERSRVVELVRGFGVWGATSAAIQAATIPIIGLVSPGLITPLFLAFTLVTTIVGALNAVANALISPLAHFFSSRRGSDAGQLVRRSTIALWLAFVIASVVVFFAIDRIASVWLTPTHCARAS
jgi:hypothetical protein